MTNTDKTMKHIYKILIAGLLSGFIFISCSDLNTDISQPQSITIHKEGIISSGHPNFHGNIIKLNNWNMKDCQQCHAADYSGGVANASCLTCHTSTRGPEACNTCHGSFTNPQRIAPPRDLSGNIFTDVKTVGAHAKHLYDNIIGARVFCSNCHNVPSAVYTEGHIDDTPGAEVLLKNLATFNAASNAQYDPETATCSNTYCHGNFEFYRDSTSAENRFAYTAEKMVGLNKTVSWTKVDGTEAECGSCHGLPPEGHIQVPLSSCYSCHQGVIDQDGNIIDKTKHVNGVLNSRGN